MIKFETHLLKQAPLDFFMEENVLKLKSQANPYIAFRNSERSQVQLRFSSALVFSARRKYAWGRSKEQEKDGRKRKKQDKPGMTRTENEMETWQH